VTATPPPWFADHVAEFRDFASGAKERIDQHATLLSEITPTIEDHIVAVAELRSDVTLLLSQLPPEPKYPPVDWWGMSADTAAKVWRDLEAWVTNVLVAWYSPSRGDLPDCWALHPGALVEMGHLMRTHQVAHLKSANPTLSAEWHGRWRETGLTGLRNAIEREAKTRAGRAGGCSVSFPHFAEETRHGHAAEPAFPGQPGAPGPYGAPHAPAPHPGRLGSHSGTRPEELLAASEYWMPHFIHARDEDIARRKAREGA
jgi:hypothetical protein